VANQSPVITNSAPSSQTLPSETSRLEAPPASIVQKQHVPEATPTLRSRLWNGVKSLFGSGGGGAEPENRPQSVPSIDSVEGSRRSSVSSLDEPEFFHDAADDLDKKQNSGASSRRSSVSSIDEKELFHDAADDLNTRRNSRADSIASRRESFKSATSRRSSIASIISSGPKSLDPEAVAKRLEEQVQNSSKNKH
jgi:hypothetical protein